MSGSCISTPQKKNKEHTRMYTLHTPQLRPKPKPKQPKLNQQKQLKLNQKKQPNQSPPIKPPIKPLKKTKQVQKFKIVNDGHKAGTIIEKNQMISPEILKCQPIDEKYQQKQIINERFGEQDNRVQANSQFYPNTAIGLLHVQTRGSRYFGTAFFVRQNIILTCAHNVWDQIYNQKVELIHFYPALNGQYGKEFKVKEVYIPQQFKQSPKNKLYDFALIILQEDPRCQQYGYMGLNFFGQQTNKQMQIIGYPGYIYKGRKRISAGKFQYQSRGKCYYNNGIIKYTMNTSRGQSGSPIIMQQNDQYYCVGIHTHKQQSNNGGVFLTKRVLKKINQWVAGIYQRNDQNLTDDMMNRLNIQSDIIKFNLDNNKITSQGMKHFMKNNLQYLTHFRIVSNQISDRGIRLFCMDSLQSLESLHIGGNKISDQGIQYIIKHRDLFEKLRELYLNENLLTDYGVNILAQKCWINLQTLSLAQNKLSDSSLFRIEQAKFPKLKWLYFEDSSFSKKALYSFVNQKWLYLIYIAAYNSFSQSDTQQLQKYGFKNSNKKRIELSLKRLS